MENIMTFIAPLEDKIKWGRYEIQKEASSNRSS